MSITIETVRTGGFEMRYFHFGKGHVPFVILPGISVQSVMGAADAIAASYQGLAEEYDVYVFDRREVLPPVYRVEDMARDTAEAMKALGLRDICLFGASQGGMMALAIAIGNPGLVRKLVVGSSTAHVTEEQFRALEEWIRFAEAGDAEALYMAFGEKLYPPDVYDAYKDVLRNTAKSVTPEDLARFIILAKGTEGFDVVSRLGEIRCPVLVIGVYEDAVLDSDATMEIAEKLDLDPEKSLYMYTGYGHAAFDTAPDYRERILRFLRMGTGATGEGEER